MFAIEIAHFFPIREFGAEFTGHDLIREFAPSSQHQLGGKKFCDGRAFLFLTGKTQDILQIFFRDINGYFHK